MENEAKKKKGFLSKFLKHKAGKIISVVLVLVIILSGVWLYFRMSRQTVKSTNVMALLEEASELTTAKLNYTGMSEFKDSGIALINKSDFIMVYEAVARVGIDVKEVKIEPDDANKVVWITIPKAKIFDINIDTGKIKYFDEGFSLFNVNEKEDANKAVALAKEEAKKKINGMGVLKMANDQAETLIKGLIQDAIPDDYEIKFKKSE